jgi:hypothetical protein
MISKPDLKTLINRYLLDGKVLLDNRRYASSLYVSGYALELAFKYKICRLLKFGNGYPETQREFNVYARGKSKYTGTTIRDIRDLRSHNLSDLLFYSGQQLRFTTVFISEWNIVQAWDVFVRYNARIVRKGRAEAFYLAARKLTNSLL